MVIDNYTISIDLLYDLGRFPVMHVNHATCMLHEKPGKVCNRAEGAKELGRGGPRRRPHQRLTDCCEDLLT